MIIKFFFEQPVALKSRTSLKMFIGTIFKTEKIKAARITYIFCSDEFLLKINKQFLKHDFYTDIITFNLSNVKSDPVLAEIYISIERVKENALNLNIPFMQELHRVMFHGVLHLCGYKDKTKEQKKLMRSKENVYLKKIGFV
jgi:rRNA maturation RNase YbeY